MKLTDYEMERVRHLDTKRALVQAQALHIDRDSQALDTEIRARLGITGQFAIAVDGTVTVPPSVQELPPGTSMSEVEEPFAPQG